MIDEDKKNKGGFMKMILQMVAVAVFLAVGAGCGPKLTKEAYVSVMAEMGCRMVQEGTPAGEALLKEKGLKQADIAAFRKKGDRKQMMEAALEIATKVAACHGTRLPTP